MDTPDLLFGYARDYLSVIFVGVPFLAVYNTYSAVLRGIGNSKVPFVAVLISSVTNAVLDYIFIVFLKLDVSGAALATVVSQLAMAVYIVLYTVVRYPNLRFSPFKLKKYRGNTKLGGKYGLPIAVQSSVSSVGNLFLQRFMNGFGEQTVAAITTAYRIDTVLLLLIINLSTAISTLVAQETGAGNKSNARKVFKLGAVIMSVMSLVLTSVIILVGKNLLSIFGLTEASACIGESFFKIIASFYVVYGLAMSIKGYLEGRADMLFTSVVGICSLAVRIACSYLFAGVWGNMVVAWAEAFSWLFLIAVFALRYFYNTARNRTGRNFI